MQWQFHLLQVTGATVLTETLSSASASVIASTFLQISRQPEGGTTEETNSVIPSRNYSTSLDISSNDSVLSSVDI
jgi:hypothetical protein